jgi:hypothetical protein
VRHASVGVYQRDSEDSDVSTAKLFGDADRLMRKRGWSRLVGVAEGDDNATLGKAVGHLPDTPLPWLRRGNVGLAAHRDGLFRALKNIRMDDEVRVITARGEYFGINEIL